MTIEDIYRCFADTIFPRTCSVCGTVLNYREKFLCIKCMSDIPLTRFHKDDFNKAEQLFAGKVPVERATSLFFYSKNNPYASILHDAKYRNMPQMAQWLTTKLTKNLNEEHFFDGIDLIMPIPLHYTKRAIRGYNQSEYIAKGISETSGIPVSSALAAKSPHATQTHKGVQERWENTRDIFTVKHPEQLEGKHILICDDVITTGSTLVSAAKEIKNIPGTKVSILTLAIARLE